MAAMGAAGGIAYQPERKRSMSFFLIIKSLRLKTKQKRAAKKKYKYWGCLYSGVQNGDRDPLRCQENI